MNRWDAGLLDGMRDVLIADETARLILRTDFGLGEQGFVGAGKDRLVNVGNKGLAQLGGASRKSLVPTAINMRLSLSVSLCVSLCLCVTHILA